MSLCVLALVQARHKASRGECALLKWRPQVEALARGEMIYGRVEGGTREGFPTLPTTALALRPFLSLGDLGGALTWAVLKVALAWWMIVATARMAAGSVRAFPPWALVALVALSARVLLSDIAHGNINIPVAALVVATGVQWQRGHERTAGLLAALGAVLKITPALFVFYFAWKRSPRALVFFVFGIALFGFAVPALFLGPSFTCDLLAGWWRQMVEPYASGAALSVVQTEHINQSMLGVLARWLTDSTAIRARAPLFPEDVSIHVASLSREALRAVLLVASVALLGGTAWCARTPRELRRSAATLGEISLVALAMLFLSERSWKQHYVVLVLPLAFLVHTLATRGLRESSGRGAALALGASTLLHGLSGSGVLGARASDYAEAYGAWFVGALALYIACAFVLRSEPRGGALLETSTTV